MQVVLIDPRKGYSQTFELRRGLIISLTAAIVTVCSLLFYKGSQYWFSVSVDDTSKYENSYLVKVEAQRESGNTEEQQNENRLDALALRLGQLQSQLLRLNAVGQRVLEKLDIGKEEFDFSQSPPMGGLEANTKNRAQSYEEIIAQLDRLSVRLNDHEFQLTALDQLRANRQIRKEGYPAGRPIMSGWLSSHYGWRTDPFSGRRTFHHGVDFAGKEGSNVVAVASGLILFAGNNGGYGKLVTIDHGDGYVTHYGHNSTVNVVPGERVSQGQTIALMGSTGRSTGPHVHFEVIRHGKKINPKKFIRTKR